MSEKEEEFVKINIVFNVAKIDMTIFEEWIRASLNEQNILDYRVLPNLDDMLDNDPYLRKLIKKKVDAGKRVSEWINKRSEPGL